MSEFLKILGDDPDGMAIYEYIVNHVDICDAELDELAYELRRRDNTGQFLASTARFLAAIDRERFADHIPALVEGAIEKDRERKYIGSLLEALWGADYQQRASELRDTDDNFRRIYKRIYPTETI